MSSAVVAKLEAPPGSEAALTETKHSDKSILEQMTPARELFYLAHFLF
jgi:hypothetical protein